jgi:hypothetical protein
MTRTTTGQTIPDSVLDKIVAHRPHLAAIVANLRRFPERAIHFEKPLANGYLQGETKLTSMETWHLSFCCRSLPFGG